jgi:O-antigen/teichoic acid export membrane protein
LVTVAIACVGALLLIIGSPWIASELLRAPALGAALMVGSGFVLFSAINGYQIGALAGLEAYRSLAKAGIISGVVVIAGTIFAAWRWGLLGAISALTATSLLRCLIHAVFVRRQLEKEGIVLRYDRLSSEKQAIFGFALPAALSGYISLPALWFGNSFLVRQSGGYEQMALYSAATNLRTLVVFLPMVVNNVALSMLNNFMGTGNRASFRKTYVTTIIANGVVVVAASVILLVGSPPLLRLYGKDFSGGFPILAILLLATLAEVLASTMYQVIQTHAKMWLSLVCVALPNYLTFILAAYLLSPRYGGRGLALAYLAEWSVALITIGILVKSISSRLPLWEPIQEER